MSSETGRLFRLHPWEGFKTKPRAACSHLTGGPALSRSVLLRSPEVLSHLDYPVILFRDSLDVLQHVYIIIAFSDHFSRKIFFHSVPALYFFFTNTIVETRSSIWFFVLWRLILNTLFYRSTWSLICLCDFVSLSPGFKVIGVGNVKTWPCIYLKIHHSMTVLSFLVKGNTNQPINQVSDLFCAPVNQDIK